ncbi:hypothetical protein CEXT_563901 [Caerostris extrusa]|uniref:Uncharacterized protein n=1 Tax=Caerostris extrusa TaxID=172846 RepID=A0AAV4XK46_CAEEX|nr:hypothetical protein CEXT_563901 [Caerostris extrusa]
MPDNKLPKVPKSSATKFESRKRSRLSKSFAAMKAKGSRAASLLKFPSFGVGVDGVSSPDTQEDATFYLQCLSPSSD